MTITRLSNEVVIRALAENLPEIKKSIERICGNYQVKGMIDFDLRKTFWGDRIFVEFKMVVKNEDHN